MKYRRKKPIPEVDYTTKEYQPCWTCKGLCTGCEWVTYRKPVPGWIAKPIYIKDNYRYADSYKIEFCPKYQRKER